MAFSGVVLIALGSGAVTLDNPGVLWCLAAAFAYSGGVLFQKVVLRRIPAAQVTWLGATIGLVACLPFAGQLMAEVSTAPTSAILGAIYLGAVPTALAFSTWAYALQRMPASQLGVSTYIVPPLMISWRWCSPRDPYLARDRRRGLPVGVAIARKRSRVLQPATALVE